MQAIYYRVNPARPGAHLFQISCSVMEPSPEGQTFTLPAWILGSYTIRDFAGNVVTLRAETGDGTVVAVRKLDKQTWACAPVNGPLTLHYEVYAWDGSVRTAYLDTTRGFFNGTSVFLRPLGFEESRCEVALERPDDPACTGWQVATAMQTAEVDGAGFGTYRAQNYAELIDHPVEMGAFTRIDFMAGEAPHRLVLAGSRNADQRRLANDLAQLCNAHIALYGDGQPPMDHYYFLTRVTGNDYGGLEHMASSSLVCSRYALPMAGEETPDENYKTFLGLCSHEYFHCWNVKRIRPEAFYHADLGQEAYTEDLWAYEGITAYYDKLMLARAGLISAQDYLKLLSKAATRLWQTPARHKQSLAESSFDAWIKFYKQGDDALNYALSYYNKGALVALCLDLKLLLETGGRIRLDHVMRALWNEFGKPGRPVPERQIEQTAEQVSGLDLEDFFNSLIRGCADPLLGELLPEFGVSCKLQRAHEADASKPGLYLGIILRTGQQAASIAHVLDGSPAQQAGIAAGDEVIAVNGLRVEGGELTHPLRVALAESPARVHVFRRDELMAFDMLPAQPPRDTWVFEPDEDAGETALRRRAAWLSYPATQ